jgi:hypothetical protein
VLAGEFGVFHVDEVVATRCGSKRLRLKKPECRDEVQARGAEARRNSDEYGGYEYGRLADWQSVQAGLITCWNIEMNIDKDGKLD